MNLLEYAMKQQRINKLSENGKIPTRQELSEIMRSGDEDLISKTWEDLELAGGYKNLISEEPGIEDSDKGKVVFDF